VTSGWMTQHVKRLLKVPFCAAVGVNTQSGGGNVGVRGTKMFK
jgi:hypothetical protein